MSDQIVVSENGLGYLQATRPWVKFLSILGFIVIALMVLMGLAMFGGGSMLAGTAGAGFGALFGLLYFVLAVLYFMPCLFLYRYGKAIATLPAAGQNGLEEALKQQKSFWKFMGILTLVMICAEVLFIFIGVFSAVAMRH